jgi:hypothetical protein
LADGGLWKLIDAVVQEPKRIEVEYPLAKTAGENIKNLRVLLWRNLN